MPSSWTIGSRPDCDVTVNEPTISGQHCRLSVAENQQGYLLEDLRSANGTYVNGRRIGPPTPVSRGDEITLGQAVPFPWPADALLPDARVITVGRDAGNEVVVALAMVSGRHARLIVEGPRREAFVEDLGSSNGTAVGSPDRKVLRSRLSPVDSVYFGSHCLPGSYLIARADQATVPTLAAGDGLRPVVIGRDPSCDRVIDSPVVSSHHARLTRDAGVTRIEDVGSANGTFVNGARIDAPTVVREGDVVGLGSYALILKEPAVVPAAPPVVAAPEPLPNRPIPVLTPAAAWAVLMIPFAVALASVAAVGTLGSAAAALATLSVAAVGVGLVNAVLGASPRLAGNPWTARLALLAALGVAEAIAACGVTAACAGVSLGTAPALGLLALATFVGLAAGCLLVSLVTRQVHIWPAVGAIFLTLWLFSGQPWPLPHMASWARLAASAAPTRWAFEGLLLNAGAGKDLAEPFFPAPDERMGVSADALALSFMLVGLAAAAGFIALERRRQPASHPHPESPAIPAS